MMLAGLTAFIALPALAAPANDMCNNAISIPANGPFPYYTTPVDADTATTTGDPPAPSCPFFPPTAARSIWYRFTPNKGGSFILGTCRNLGSVTTMEDTILAVYTSASGCSGPFTEVPGGCNDDGCGPTGLQSELVVTLNASVTYYIVAWHYGTTPPLPGESTVQLVVGRLVAPTNDVCSGVIQVQLNQPVYGATLGATNQYQLANASCFQGLGQLPVSAQGRDVVYSFTAPSAGKYSFKALDFLADGDLVLYVAASCPSGPFPAMLNDCLGAANRNSVSTAESVECVPLMAGQTVYVFVDDESQKNGSGFRLEITTCVEELEPNDSRGTSQPLISSVSGSMPSPGDVDFFSLGSPPAGSRVFALLDAEAANRTDFDMRIVTATETLEFDDNDNDLAFGQSAPNVSGAILDGSPAYVRINMNVSSPVEPYRIYAVVQPSLASAALESEPNDTLAAASSSTLNYFYGNLAEPTPSDDVDMYSFMAQAGDLIFLGLDCDPTKNNTGLKAGLTLLNSAGEVLSAVSDPSSQSNTNTTPGLDQAFQPTYAGESLAIRVGESGRYYACVALGGFTFGPDGAGDYLLSIARNGLRGSPAQNTPPSLTGVTAVSPIAKGSTTTVSGTIIDPDLGHTHSVTIDWADGSTPTDAYLWAGGNNFAFDHVYADAPGGANSGVYSVHVAVRDYFGGSASSNIPVTVMTVAPAQFGSVSLLPNGNFQMHLTGTAQAAYQIHVSSDLKTWDYLATRVANGQGEIVFEDTTTPHPTTRFYKARAQ